MSTVKKVAVVLLAGLLFLALTGCGDAKSKDTITIYDGQFAEMKLIHQMVKLLVEENTGAKVEILDEVAPVNSYKELVKGTADIMNSYDGTLLTTYLHLDPDDVPENMTLYDFVNEEAADKGVRLLDKLGLNNTYAIGVSQELVEEHDLKTVSDLVPIADQLIFGAEHDFFTEEGSAKFNPFAKFYGLDFKEVKHLDITLKYTAFESGELDVMIVYATDGLNRKAQLTVLEDDRGYFPEYNGALLVRDDMFERLEEVAPDLEEVLNQLGGLFTDEIMVDLSYRVDVEKEKVEDVARDFLESKGLL